jgi:hypothetical protein
VQIAACGDVMRLIQIYAARLCFKASIWLALLGKRLSGI